MWAAIAVVALAVATAVAPAPMASGQGDDEALRNSTWNPLNRSSAGHFRVADPANVSADEAESVYRSLSREMGERYALSGISAAQKYLGWTRYSTAPYRSVTHGRSYLNNYANRIARAYGRYEKAGIFPVGSVLAKDSFSISKSGEIRPGPLFLMEKMEAGFNPKSGDWRYTEVLPDGSVLGITKGDNAGNVNYCASCHAAAGKGRDHVFFPRKAFRRQFSAEAR